MKLRDTILPYITVGIVITALMLIVFGPERAQAFVITYTIGYAGVMVYLAGTE